MHKHMLRLHFFLWMHRVQSLAFPFSPHFCIRSPLQGGELAEDIVLFCPCQAHWELTMFSTSENLGYYGICKALAQGSNCI